MLIGGNEYLAHHQFLHNIPGILQTAGNAAACCAKSITTKIKLTATADRSAKFIQTALVNKTWNQIFFIQQREAKGRQYFHLPGHWIGLAYGEMTVR